MKFLIKLLFVSGLLLTATATFMSVATSARAEHALEVLTICTEQIQGASQCMGGQRCYCRYDQGGLITNRKAGWQWVCDGIDTSCVRSHHEPAAANPYRGNYPNAVHIDRSTETITIDNNSTSTNTNSNTATTNP